ncbi:serine protease [Duganella sp. BJB476]|uniref:S1 family peptidase n=1 Tax=Duganella sp. BJB476 TaxID=1871176 RepID=UPI000E346334|nr:serine protease [Duganella sp. BJB476]RFP27443.1 serine protease [Duganella sp. BJB476]
MQQETQPQFSPTGHETPLTEYAILLIASKGEKCFASGTAIIVGSNLAITATHVISDFMKMFDNVDYPQDGAFTADFSIQAVQIIGQQQIAVWNVVKTYNATALDITFLALLPHTDTAEAYRWRIPVIALTPPATGSTVLAFGYPRSSAKIAGLFSGDVEISVISEPAQATGTVLEVYPQSRDSVMAPFPCFLTNARLDGGMSGGPVFDDQGRLCGIVCSSLPPSEDDDSHSSTVSLLWPALVTEMDLPVTGLPPGGKYEVLELAKLGIIVVEDIERLRVQRHADGSKTIRFQFP